MDDRRRFSQRRCSGKGTFGPRLCAGRLERQDIGRAEVAAELLGHDVIALGEEAALQGALDL